MNLAVLALVALCGLLFSSPPLVSAYDHSDPWYMITLSQAGGTAENAIGMIVADFDQDGLDDIFWYILEGIQWKRGGVESGGGGGLVRG